MKTPLVAALISATCGCVQSTVKLAQLSPETILPDIPCQPCNTDSPTSNLQYSARVAAPLVVT